MPFFRKHFFWIVTICFALAMGFELRHLGPKLFGSGQNKDEQARSETRMKITEYVSNLRKNLPMRIDEATVLVDVRAEDLSVKFMN